jgi:hypothetical protein
MQTSLPAKTCLPQQAVRKETDDKKFSQKQAEYLFVSQQIFLHKPIKKASRSSQVLTSYSTSAEWYSSRNPLCQNSVINKFSVEMMRRRVNN